MSPFLATIGAKLAAGGLVLALLLSLYGLGRYHGRAACQAEHDAAITKQAVQSADVVVKAAENTGRVLIKYDKAAQRAAATAEARATALQKELDAYVQTHPVCPVPDELVRVFDAPPADRVPTAPNPASGTVEAPAPFPVTGVLQALADTQGICRDNAIQHEALIEWVQTSYQIQKAGAGR